MKLRIPGSAFLGAVVLASVAWLTYYSTGEIARAADEVMQDEVARGAFSGVALVSRGGRVIFEKAYGLADAEWNVPNTTGTKFRIGSITKSFTSVLVMQLEQQHLLKLEDSVCRYIDECPAGWDAITLHHLLSHTSGIFNFTQDPDVWDSFRAVSQTHDQVLARFRHKPLAFEPGSRFEYSNSNYYLLGIVIEKVSGVSFETVLHRQILEPLGMRDTGVWHREALMPGRARGYRRNGQGTFDNDPDMHETWAFSAGALYSTVEDLAKFSDALATDRLLPGPARERMWHAVEGGYAYGWEAPAPELTFNRRVVEHGGRVPGFGARLRRFVDDDVTVVVLANRLDADPSRAAGGLSAVAFGEPYESVFDRKSIRLSPEALRRYVGDYEFNGRIATVFERDGNLFAREGEGAPEIQLLAETETLLFIPGMRGNVEPVVNRRGEIVGLNATLGASVVVFHKVR